MVDGPKVRSNRNQKLYGEKSRGFIHGRLIPDFCRQLNAYLTYVWDNKGQKFFICWQCIFPGFPNKVPKNRQEAAKLRWKKDGMSKVFAIFSWPSFCLPVIFGLKRLELSWSVKTYQSPVRLCDFDTLVLKEHSKPLVEPYLIPPDIRHNISKILERNYKEKAVIILSCLRVWCRGPGTKLME